MKMVYTSPNIIEVGLRRSLLEDAGIPCFVRNEQISQMTVLRTYMQQELCVLRDEDAERAAQILATDFSGGVDAESLWICAGCNEENEGQFTACWNCLTERAA